MDAVKTRHEGGLFIKVVTSVVMKGSLTFLWRFFFVLIHYMLEFSEMVRSLCNHPLFNKAAKLKGTLSAI